MARPRSYELPEVIAAAKQVFWERGYEGTSLSDLEFATGLSRSSLYLAFGTKRDLFDAVLAEYVESFIDPRLRPVEAPAAGLREAAGFFSGLATHFRDRRSQRGCLLINSIAELAGTDPGMEATGAEFINRLRGAFLNALRDGEARGTAGHRQAAKRSEILAASSTGVWFAARVDHAAAAATCRAITTEITSWGVSGTG
jgi:TetR/AcrR family transcriptional regulator, transcriptional repressor for nem operon